MPTERLANLGYLALKKETTPGTAVTPDVYVPLYEESLMTDAHLDEDAAIIGNKFKTFQALQGQRSHGGDVKTLAEPNTAARLFDMLLTKGTTTGSNPYTHPYTLSGVTDPKFYSIDVCRGQVVSRFYGAGASEIGIDFDENKMLFNTKVSSLKSFQVREIASVSGSGPYTVTLKTNYDPSPTDGLVVGDLIRFHLAAGTTVDATVASITGVTTFTCSTNPTVAAGDWVALRPATPSLTVVQPFLWSRTEFRFSNVDAAGALSATQTRLEKGSKWTVMHEFENKEGSRRSGGFDPASLPRLKGGVELEAKAFFDTPDDLNRFLTVQKKACVVRSFSDTGYELRMTINNLKISENPPALKEGEIIYQELKFIPQYDTTDGQGMDVKIINAISTI